MAASRNAAVKGESVCASLQGIPLEPSDKTNDQSFRGSVSGFGFAYCDFTRRVSVAVGISGRHQPRAGQLDGRGFRRGVELILH